MQTFFYCESRVLCVPFVCLEIPVSFNVLDMTLAVYTVVNSYTCFVVVWLVTQSSMVGEEYRLLGCGAV
jgi:hypothetical protein